MNLYSQNLELFRRKRPDIFSILKSAKPDLRLEFVPTDSGLPTARVSVQGEPGVEFYSGSPNPLSSSKQSMSAFNFEPHGTTVLLGIGLGYELAALWDYRPKSHKLIIIERFPGLLAVACHLFNLTELIEDSNVEIILADDDPDPLRLFNERQVLFGDLEFVCGASYVLASAKYEAIRHKFSQLADSWRSAAVTQSRFSEIRFQNFLNNILSFRRSHPASKIAGAFSKMPALIIGGGPSAGQYAPQIAELKNRALLVAVDSIYPVLRDAGVSPDFVATLDPQAIAYGKIDGRVSFRDPALIYHPAAHPDIPHHFALKYVWQSRNDPYGRWLSENVTSAPTFDSPMTSVMHLAYYTAVLLGCSPIYFIGTELAFPSSSSHAAGVKLQLRPTDIANSSCILAPSSNGNTVPTNSVFLEMESVLSQAISQYKTECYNLTPIGLCISGAPHRPAEEVFTRLKARPQSCCIEKVFEQHLQSLDPNKTKISLPFLKQIARELEKTLDQTDKLLANSQFTSMAFHSLLQSQPRRLQSLTSEVLQPLNLLVEREHAQQAHLHGRSVLPTVIGSLHQIYKSAHQVLLSCLRKLETEQSCPAAAKVPHERDGDDLALLYPPDARSCGIVEFYASCVFLAWRRDLTKEERLLKKRFERQYLTPYILHIWKNATLMSAATRRALASIRTEVEAGLLSDARNFFESGALEAAHAKLRELLWRQPNHIVGTLLSCEVLLRTGKLNRFDLLAGRLLKARPDWLFVYLVISRRYWLEGAAEQTANVLEQAAQRVGLHQNVLLQTSRMLREFESLKRINPVLADTAHGQIELAYFRFLTKLNYPFISKDF